MIAVIADDFTGAAELAGISLRYGLKVELTISEVPATHADVLVVSTDSRSLKKAEAIRVTTHVLKQVLKLEPVFVYKKIDSVLRGYVLEELKVQMRLMGKASAFIVPANPSLGRTISKGEYFIDGKHISKTGFAADPEFPVQSSSVKAILRDESVHVLTPADELPGEGIVVGEAVNEDDIQRWANIAGEDRALAGAGDFYTALLRKRYKEQKQGNIQLQLPYLYVCGTAYSQSVKRIKAIDEKLDAVMYINKQMILSSTAGDPIWLSQCRDMLRLHQKAVIAFDEEQVPAGSLAAALRGMMAKTVKLVVERNVIKELFIEGGSTATAVLQELNIRHLSPVNELKRGVVRMKAGDLYITVKPGSYELPEEIKELFSS